MAGTKGGKGGPKRQAKVRSPHSLLQCTAAPHHLARRWLLPPPPPLPPLPLQLCSAAAPSATLAFMSASSRRVAPKPRTPAAAVAVQPSSGQPRGRRPSSKERSWCVLFLFQAVGGYCFQPVTCRCW